MTAERSKRNPVISLMVFFLRSKNSERREFFKAEERSSVEALMDEIYKSHSIRTEHELNLETDCWIPRAKISWVEDGVQCSQTLAGPADIFKVIDEAERYAVEMAKIWIDDYQRKRALKNRRPYDSFKMTPSFDE